MVYQPEIETYAHIMFKGAVWDLVAYVVVECNQVKTLSYYSVQWLPYICCRNLTNLSSWLILWAHLRAIDFTEVKWTVL